MQAQVAMDDYFTNSGRIVDAESDSGIRTYALFNHLVSFLNLGSSGVPLVGLIAAIIMWQVRKGDSPFLDDHGREAVNFQLSFLAYILGGAIFTLITFGLGALLYLPAMLVLMVIAIVGPIRGAMAAHRGEYYRYPCCIRFLKAPDEV